MHAITPSRLWLGVVHAPRLRWLENVRTTCVCVYLLKQNSHSQSGSQSKCDSTRRRRRGTYRQIRGYFVFARCVEYNQCLFELSENNFFSSKSILDATRRRHNDDHFLNVNWSWGWCCCGLLMLSSHKGCPLFNLSCCIISFPISSYATFQQTHVKFLKAFSHNLVGNKERENFKLNSMFMVNWPTSHVPPTLNSIQIYYWPTLYSFSVCCELISIDNACGGGL